MRRGADFGTTRQDDDAGGGISDFDRPTPKLRSRSRAGSPSRRRF
jgi:hypothetical protein